MGNWRFIRAFAFCAAVAGAATGCPGGEGGPSEDAVAGFLDRATGPRAGGDGTPLPARRATRVAITVVSAEGLPDKDDGPGETDAYVVLEYEGVEQRTSVVEGELNPKWGDSFVFAVVPGGTLQVSMMDEDGLGSDELIGVVSQPLPGVLEGETQDLVVGFRNGDYGLLKLTITGLEAP